MKWAAIGLVLTLLAAGTVRTLSARKARQSALEAQQAAQKIQVSIDLAVADLVQVKALELTQNVAISGPIRAVNTAWVKARVPGELRDLTVREGDSVRAGQVLARIDPTESDARVRQARQQAAAAKAQVDIAQRSFDNNRALVTQGFISSTALESSQANLASAQANYAAAQSGADLAAKALDDTVLRAPITGQISQRLAQTGERVAVEARVVEIVDNRQLELEASLNAADSLQVKVGQSAQLQLDGTAQALQAKVVRINPSAVVGSRAVLVYLALAPSTNLRHGLFAQGELNIGNVKALALPLSAVRTDKPQPYVQLISQKQVQHVNVTLGARGELAGVAMVAVTGVPEGSVVIDGAVGSLRAGTLVTTAAPAPGTK
ncbi:MAG: efflux RND transporter periplasmic adaptor subunit [Rhodoferax sp.]|uniref:efflux RND transporter periplasmic adaptor subunit n=1 Tax=Rhodoferax sp. TaxID=50421 RepID=UPI00262F9252|nr:efflux RND transporter periplasmic adaptor subunit [Rhodoferax sp.]MDD2882049.1 efflux RND transporter periplasmic adaptor subunit [Rhodoferax sp.]